jgi:hypothetical protein
MVSLGSQPSFHQLPEAEFHLGNTGSPNSLQVAKEWLKGCREGHARCNTSVIKNPRSWLPHRVLDLGDPTQPLNSEKLRLLEFNEEEGSYVCLSHCWGSSSVFTTTKATLRSMLSNIPWPSLPKTFQDAIAVTHKLGLRYLWIDSLCIVQDDVEDWGRESALMEVIYGGSMLTLAATASSDASEGLLFDLPQKFAHREIKVPNESCVQGKVFYRHNLPHSEEWQRVDSRIGDYPLLNRAWVFQERFLSPRILHFTKTELTWECMETTTCQCILDQGWPPRMIHLEKASSNWFKGQGGLYQAEADPAEASIIRFPKERYADMALSPSKYDLCEKWNGILKQYCKLDITLGKDKLPALSGIARLMQGLRNNERYLAGLWKDHLHRDLCWYFDDPAPRHSLEWRAPSWSWASVNGKQLKTAGPQYTFGKKQNGVKVLEASCTLSGTDATGQVASGQIIFSGWLLRGKLKKGPLNRPRFETRSCPWYSSFQPDFPVFEKRSGIKEKAEIFLLRISDVEMEMSSLVLRRNENATYLRIGFLKSTNKEWQQAKWIETTLVVV